jgi:hypothetical protein
VEAIGPKLHVRLRRLEKLAAREVYERRLRSLPGAQRIVEIVFVVALTAFIVLLSIGVLRRWRWTFWLIVITFLFGVLRIPVAALQLSGQMTPDGPPWYVILQGVIGVLQVLIGLTMVRGYRRSGLGMVMWPELHNPTNAFRIVVGDAADDFEIRPSPDRLPGLLFVPVPEEKADKDRLHLDFRLVDQTAEVERLLSSVLGGPMSGSVTRHGWYSPTLKAMSSASFVDGFGPIPRSRRHYDHSPFPSVRDRPGAGSSNGPGCSIAGVRGRMP